MPLPHDMSDLIDSYLDGELSSTMIEQLRAWLEAGDANVDFFAHQVFLHQQLRESMLVENTLESLKTAEGATAVADAKPAIISQQEDAGLEGALDGTGTSGLFGQSWRSAIIFFSGIIVALAGVGGWLLLLSSQSGNPLAQVPAENATPVAFLTVDNGCDWGGSTPGVWAVGRSVQLGDEIALNEGIAEFRLANGVYLSIEGPTSIVLVSPSALVLQYGKLTAHVPWTVTDFRAAYGECRVTACDAEFGMHQEGNRFDVHVFSGDVRVESPQGVTANDPGVFTRATVTASKSLSLVSDGEVYKVRKLGGKAVPERFATKLPMAGELPISQSYVDAVLNSKPLGYWRFESTSEGAVANEVTDGTELIAGGTQRLARRVGNSSLEFQPGSNAYFLSQPLHNLGGKEFSVELWLKPSHIHWGGALALVTGKPAEDQAFYLELLGPRNKPGSTPIVANSHPGAIRVLHRDPPEGGSGTGTSCFSKNPYNLRRWQHIVATKGEGWLRLYVDGVLVGAVPDDAPLAKGLHLVVGGVGTFTFSRKVVGQLDEVAIYGRALTVNEIKKHYQAVQWRPEHTPGNRDDEA